MPRKIAFISPVSIRLPKEAEEKIGIRRNNVYVEYRHPVLYIVRATKKDKDYVYVYCGKTTYVLMKIRDAHLEEILSILKDVLKDYVREEDIEEFEAEIRLYCFMSHIIEEIYNDALRVATENYKNYSFTLLHFDPLLRRKMRKPLATNIARIALSETIHRHYVSLPIEIKEKLSYESFSRIITSEISLKNLVRNIFRGVSSS